MRALTAKSLGSIVRASAVSTEPTIVSCRTQHHPFCKLKIEARPPDCIMMHPGDDGSLQKRREGERAASTSLEPPPLPLRPSRSANNLYEWHDPPETGIVDSDGHVRLESAADSLDPSGLDEGRPGCVRRIRSSSAISTPPELKSNSDDASKWRSAWGDARYFAGGLVIRPSESTRHYSVIRHSHALIWYRGPSTAVSITILSDQPLPANRSIWMQQKGLSGNLGMSLKTLAGSTRDWLDVTPILQAKPEHVDEIDERGIQRDLKRFAAGQSSGRLSHRVPRETCIVRIPAAAADGYFRLIVCGGDPPKTPLCESPVFRIASTSTDSAVIRGASLKTMPLEVGLKIASVAGQQWGRKYTSVAGLVAKAGAARAIHKQEMTKAGQLAYVGYKSTGMGKAMREHWRSSQSGRFDPLLSQESMETPVGIIGSDDGPSEPFPLKFNGRVRQDASLSRMDLGGPTVRLDGVSDALKMRLDGVFAAWVCVPRRWESAQQGSEDWHEAVVSIAPAEGDSPGVVTSTVVTVQTARDFGDVSLLESKMKVLLMAYIRPALVDGNLDELVDQRIQDMMASIVSLSRENWDPQRTLSRAQSARGDKSFTQRFTDATAKMQQHIDRIPLHLVGVRSESSVLRDRAYYGRGGMWIPRDERSEAPTYC